MVGAGARAATGGAVAGGRAPRRASTNGRRPVGGGAGGIGAAAAAPRARRRPPPPVPRRQPLLSLSSFCYHQRLSIAGNCRMCVVEVEKSPKPVASCAMPAGPGMNIKTDTPLVKKAREGVMEFLLLNHPLDCPICDQGGECDLQDQAMAFGSDRGRFAEAKRSVADKDVGPLVKTVMTRCIHCTRCVRFATEIAGVQDMGITGRGNASEVGTYISKALTSELSGNLIDLCPVGALTSKPYAFTARQWELKGTESIDVTDALGANVRVDARGPEVMRVVPTLNDAVNEEWLSDKARFSYDGLKRQRLATPMVRGASGRLEATDWATALAAAGRALASAPGERLRFVAGALADAESMALLADAAHRLGSGDLWFEDGSGGADVGARGGYSIPAGAQGAAAVDGAGAILLVGANPRAECAVLNARLRRASMCGASVATLGGGGVDLTYPAADAGDAAAELARLAGGAGFGATLKDADGALILVGSSVTLRPDGAAVLAAAHAAGEALGATVGVLQAAAARAGAAELGFAPSARARSRAADPASPPPSVVYLLAADDAAEGMVPDGAFVVYQGHHGDAGAARADVVLPGAAYTEKDATYVNTFGTVQRTRAAVPRVGDAREDWRIVRALSEVAGVRLAVDTRADVDARLAQLAPALAAPGAPAPAAVPGLAAAAAAAAARGVSLAATPLAPRLARDAFYQTDPISRTSVVMAKAAAARRAADAESDADVAAQA